MFHSVFQDWLFTLPYRMQSVLVAALRGCDTAKKDDDSKAVTRALRGVILNNADPSNTFICDKPDEKKVTQFLWDIDALPQHFVAHTMHACEIIGYKHPKPETRAFWLDLYQKMVKSYHTNYETEAQLDIRLGFTPAERTKLSVEDRPLELGAPPVISTDEQKKRHKKGKDDALKKKPPAQVNEAYLLGYHEGLVEREQQWEAGTGTSHGGRDRAYSGGS